MTHTEIMLLMISQNCQETSERPLNAFTLALLVMQYKISSFMQLQAYWVSENWINAHFLQDRKLSNDGKNSHCSFFVPLYLWVITSLINLFVFVAPVCFNGWGGRDAECLMVIQLVEMTQTGMRQSWRWCIWCSGHEPFMYFNSWGRTAECLMVI